MGGPTADSSYNDIFFNIPFNRIELGPYDINRSDRVSDTNNDELKTGLYAPVIAELDISPLTDLSANQTLHPLIRDGSSNITHGTRITINEIFTTDIATSLTVNGGQVAGDNTANPIDNFNIVLTNGSFTRVQTSQLILISDERIKTNIQEASYENAYELIKDISINSYDYEDANRPHQKFGFVAQQVKEIMPNVVKTAPGNYTADGRFIPPNDTTTPVAISDLQVVDKNSLFQLLFAGFKHSQQEIETLKQRITTLENP